MKLRLLLLIVKGVQRLRGGDAAMLLGIMRFKRIVQLIEENRPVR